MLADSAPYEGSLWGLRWLTSLSVLIWPLSNPGTGGERESEKEGEEKGEEREGEGPSSIRRLLIKASIMRVSLL